MAHVTEDHRSRLFWASCLALISTSVAFGVITSSMEDFGEVFGLVATQKGWVGGAALGGFAVAILLLGPVIDRIGIARTIGIAFSCHVVGTLLMTFAGGFTQLMAGATVIALGNGAVEAGCNPLVATLYPGNKTTKLNQFHVFWPLGIILGGLYGFAINNLGGGAEGWTLLGLTALQAKLVVVILPTLVYGFLFRGEPIPQTERVQSNVPDREVWAAVRSPLFLLMLFCMMLTANLELGPGRWMDSVMSPAVEEAGIASYGGILVLVYGSGLMAILRYFAGGFVHRFSPTGLLLGSAVLGGVGLFAMTYAASFTTIFLTATVFYVGVCYFWPTMLGFVSEQIPRSGALGLCLMGGIGMLAVGYVGSPLIGWLQESHAASYLAANPEASEGEAAVHGGKMAFRGVAASAIVLAVVFGSLHRKFARGGYSARSIAEGGADDAPPPAENAEP